MHTEVYANPHESAQAEPSNPTQSPDNFLHLLPEHRNEINNQWLSHIAKQRISGNGLRLLNSIYRHTIGFNKISDDMSGLRLQQISCIRADHANHTLKLLAADHAIVSTQGRYGRVLSINFNFAAWSNTHKNDAAVKLIRDPRHLLPKRYHEDPIDTGNVIGEPDEHRHNHNAVVTATQLAETPPTPAPQTEIPPTTAPQLKFLKHPRHTLKPFKQHVPQQAL